jgi:hypothetical protein
MPDAPGSSFSTYSAVLPKTMGPSWSLGGHDSCHVSPNGIWVCEVLSYTPSLSFLIKAEMKMLSVGGIQLFSESPVVPHGCLCGSSNTL